MLYVVSYLGMCCFVVTVHMVNVVTFILCILPATAQIFQISLEAAVGKTLATISWYIVILWYMILFTVR